MRRASFPTTAATALILALGAGPLEPQHAAPPGAQPAEPPGAPPATRPAAQPAAAQGPPVGLVADQLDIDQEARTVTASGNVEVHYQGRVLRARSITFDDAAGEVRVAGPLTLTDLDGGVVLADEAALTPDLAAGLIRDARLLIAGQLQVAATEVRRSEDRYTTLHRTVASTCEICIGEPVPTWAIRADRVIRDEEELQIHFRNAVLELFGVPVLWLPYLRIPDPTVARASGLLVPEFRRSQIYGAGIRVPYYRVLGPSADLTLTPFVTEKGGTLLEADYRRRFDAGSLDVGGVFTLDNGLDERSLRGALTVLGAFDLPQDFRFDLDVALTSDDDFLEQYDYSDADRLTSSAIVSRTRGDAGGAERIAVGVIGFQSLRANESSSTVPFILPEAGYRRTWQDAVAGGRLGVELDALGVLRDGGSDVLRLGGGADWRRDWIMGPGIVAEAAGGALLDLYRTWDDTDFPEGQRTRVAPFASVELRWPLARTTAPGATHVLEPIGQLAWGETWGEDAVPNEDSQLVEFDETNLFALNRFPGRDRLETGLRANLGIGYSILATGWQAGLQIGRVFRTGEENQFASGTGLRGRSSDWVAAAELDLDWGLSVLNRLRVDSDLTFRRNEFGLAYAREGAALNASYVYLAADDSNPDLGPQPESSELTLDAAYRVAPHWQVRGNWRYDLATDSNIRAGGGVIYGNECAEFDLSVSRRFTSSASVPPSTSIGFTIRLTGLGAAGSEDWPTRSCRG